MHTGTRRVRARVRGRHLELLEPVNLSENEEVTVTIEMPATERDAVLRALDESAGAWTDAEHPDLVTREDVVQSVLSARTRFERTSYGQ